MLTANQVETVAFTDDNGTIRCLDCARKEYGHDASLAEQGLPPYPNPTPLSRYAIDDHHTAMAYELAYERAGQYADATDEEYDAAAVECEDCYCTISD